MENKIIITDNETFHLLKDNNIMAHEIPEQIIEDKDSIESILKDNNDKNKNIVFASLNPKYITIFNKYGFETMFINTRNNDHYDIKPTYEKRLLKIKNPKITTK